MLFFLFFLFKISDSYAFVGGASMGAGVGGGASSAGSPSIKSGISIVDPEGKAFNCEPFVDKKWESTSFEDSWNGVYFSLGYENSKFSGGFKVEDSSPEYFSSSPYTPTNSKKLQAVAPPLRAYTPTNSKKLQAVAPPLRGSGLKCFNGS